MLHKNSTRPLPKRQNRYRPLPLFQNGADLPIFTQSPDVATLPQGGQTLISNPQTYTQMALLEVPK